MSTAVVLGGGFAGVLAARVLTAGFDRVVLVEGDRYPRHPGVRAGLPQAHHNHVLVTGGARALEELLPGTLAELAAHGAHRRGLTGDALILSDAGWFRRHETGSFVISCSRWLTDHVVRRRALAGTTVTVREDTRVLGLTGDAGRVTGAVVAGPDGRAAPLRADLVVDATGRRSRAPRWLAELGGAPVEERTVDPGFAYSTRVYRAPDRLTAAMPAIMLHPRGGYGATLFPIEDGRWIVTLTGSRERVPPADAPGFEAATAGLASPILAELLAAAAPDGAVRPYRGTANRRRFFERRSPTAGLLVLGDALSSTNPVYSHGMSVAALSVRRLARELASTGPHAGLQAAVAAEVDLPWRMAVDQDRPPAPAPRRALALTPALIGAMFHVQTLAGGPPVGLPAGRAQPALSTDEAVAQFPCLSDWRTHR